MKTSKMVLLGMVLVQTKLNIRQLFSFLTLFQTKFKKRLRLKRVKKAVIFGSLLKVKVTIKHLRPFHYLTLSLSYLKFQIALAT